MDTDMEKKTLTINGKTVEIGDERNLLETIRKIGIDIPTFCYHSKLSVYGACRLCLVEIEGRGIVASCSTKPEPGMVVHTDSKQIRAIRKVNVELLLANHKRECPTCVRGSFCTLQNLARRLGVDEIRYKQTTDFVDIDNSSPSLTRDPNKCVLCGDCVRMCKEVQGIGAIDFAYRGAKARVTPSFSRMLGEVECVNCGQCAAVCPTGAITPKQDREPIWSAIHDPTKIVVAQVAPAVRVALGEYFNMKPGENVAGKLVSALRMMGFDYVFDTTFAADMTIVEEAEELLRRVQAGGPFPMFTSCCPGWVKYAEMNFPDLLPNLSSCRSPQQMFGSVIKEAMPKMLNVKREDIVVVSIMPCTAKKFEAQLDKFKVNGNPDVDYVLTTLEIGRMINFYGVRFNDLDSEAFDMPFGFGTGAGVIFGTTGGVMEAALRYAYEKTNGKVMHPLEFKDVRGVAKLKTTDVKLGDIEAKVAVVHTLAEAKKIAEEAVAGKSPYQFIEVMACPGGCVCGGGQPIQNSMKKRISRMESLYQTDKHMQFQKSQDNPEILQCYDQFLEGKPNSHKAHTLLHTVYANRDGVFDSRSMIRKGTAPKCISVAVCVTPAEDSAHQSEKALTAVMELVDKLGLMDKVNFEASYCPSSMKDRKPGEILVGDVHLTDASEEEIGKAIQDAVAKL